MSYPCPWEIRFHPPSIKCWEVKGKLGTAHKYNSKTLIHCNINNAIYESTGIHILRLGFLRPEKYESLLDKICYRFFIALNFYIHF